MKKGFTLVELLSVIIVLGIISLIVFPVVRNQVEIARAEAYKRTVTSIEAAAQRYGTTHNLGYPTTESVIQLDTLINEGLLERKKLVDPTTDEALEGCVFYKWNETNKVYEYRYEPSC